MIVQRQAQAVFLLSVAAGLFLSPAIDHRNIFEEAYAGIQEGFSPSDGNHSHGALEKGHSHHSSNSSFKLGTAHEHALFYVVINGTEKDFSSEKFQLNAEYVHLENNKSNIVHKHAKGVEWKDFLETINITVETRSSRGKDQLCVEIYDDRSCGNGSVILNNEKTFNFSKKIQQGDNFLIVLETENQSSLIDEYMKKQLPRLYKPQASRGKRI